MIYIYKGFSIPYRKLGRVGFEPTNMHIYIYIYIYIYKIPNRYHTRQSFFLFPNLSKKSPPESTCAVCSKFL